MFKKLMLTGSMAFMCLVASAQVGSITLSKKDGLTDTAKTKAKVKIKPYKEIIPDTAKTSRGLFIVHKVEDKYFMEIPSNVLGKDMLAVTRLAKSSAGFRMSTFGYAGDQINESVIRFEKGPDNNVFIRTVSYMDYSRDSTKAMYTAVKNSNIQPIAAAFDIKTFSPGKKNMVIEVTSFINGENDLFYFDSKSKSQLKLSGLASDKSYINTIRTYPTNTEISTVKTYTRSGETNVTLELNTSIILLPEHPMKARLYDRRVGYFAGGFYDYDSDSQGVKDTYFVRRWRLEPKEEDIAKYKSGQLVEPKKQIVIYIDPATPKKWVPYLIQGVNDWQKAFEKAGFKNAIIAKQAPTKQQDSTWSIDDARFSAIVYKPSPIANASGPHIADPRTGEILETHINWYHNVMKLLQQWYFVQTAAVDKRARKMEFDDELMGQLIRFVSSHEVGHTLGLRHNFGASSATPVELLRNKKWVEEHGHTSSIMDYARFNYVAQPEDNISEKGLYPRIGDYDTWAIEWGYKWLPQFNDPADEKPYLNKLTIEKLKDKRLWFGREDNSLDPRAQSEDLGDNAMKASAYGIKNLQVIMKNLPEWTRTPNEDYSDLNQMYNQVLTQYQRYILHVTKNVGGVYETFKTVEQPGEMLEAVPASVQHEAMTFFKDHLFKTPTWLVENKMLNLVGQRPSGVLLNTQALVLNKLIHGFTMDRLISAETMDGPSAYKLNDLFNDLYSGIWTELDTKEAINIHRRDLQKLYVEKFSSLLNVKMKSVSDLSQGMDGLLPQGLLARTTDSYAMVKGNLLSLQEKIRAAIPTAKDQVTKYHWQYLDTRITEILTPRADNIN